MVWRKTSTPRTSEILGMCVSYHAWMWTRVGLVGPLWKCLHLFRLSLDVRMYECYMVIATYDVPKRR